MTAEEFAFKISTLLSYADSPIIVVKTATKFKDELLKLIDTFDIVELEVASVRLSSTIIENEDFYILGREDDADIVIDKKDGMVKIYDPYEKRTIYECASNGGLFLDLLYAVAQFFDTFDIYDQKEGIQYAEEFIKMYDYEKFRDFVEYIFPVW